MRLQQSRRSLPRVVLVVDDEPALLRFMCDLLRGQGLRVLAAANGNVALEIVRRLKRSIRVLVADIEMPGRRWAGIN